MTDRAKEFLEQVIRNYPKTKAAQTAKARLESWGLK
jgi:TolA-binding protein